ncbi:hypothetical protein P12x_000943 [Tundrisphaera lichenicola]|uniref:hypothetical protein n=1 Tax=Tundrisphaera lichenicola TaxID=2029860 RepID=UPI003EB8A796
MEATTSNRVPPGTALAPGLITLILALAPALAAIAWIPEFVTQDGPAHAYNARILNASLGSDSPLKETFQVNWQPLPNWSGHLSTMALVATLGPDRAGRAMAAITLVVLASGVTWLRWVVAGTKGLAPASILAVLLGLNVTWLLGFTSFLLGAALMPVTLALWWGGRDRPGLGRTVSLSSLLVLGYFCHPIGLGLTVVGLAVLSILTPGPDRVRRTGWTAACLIPLVPLGLAYRAMTRSAGAMEPTWDQLANPWSLRSWAAQVGWVDPISLAAKTFRPFGMTSWVGNGLVSPALWTALAVAIAAAATWRGRSAERRGWLVLAVLLLLGGLLGPDTLGVKHGHYLPQRVALLGLVTLVPWLDLGGSRKTGWVASACLGFALVVQSAFVWDYALGCRDRVGAFLKAGPAIGPGQRVGTLLVGIKGRFRSNPMLHADCLLGVEPDRIIWNNYETAHYYFPVKVRAGIDHPPAPDFERVALLDGPSEAEERARTWERILNDHGPSIDVILEWATAPAPELDAINEREYQPTFHEGPVRVWARRPPAVLTRGLP